MGDRVAMLRAQLDVTWGLAEHHLARLTDADLLWEPGSPCWTVHRGDDGRWRPDWEVPEPDPVPTPSAAWVSWHLGWWWTTALAHLRGRPVPAREDVTWPGDAAATAAWLRGLHRDWVALLEATREPDLDAVSTFPWPAEQGRTVADTLAWAGAELAKNVAEIGQLRLLCATRRDRADVADPWGPVLDRAHEWAGRWLAALPSRPVGVPVDPSRMRSLLPDRLPERGEDPLDVLADLGAALEPGLVAGGGPRYFGFVTGGALPVALAADWMTAAADQNAATYVMSPAAATVEEVTGRWVLDLLGLPADAAVGFVTGAQGANTTCLAAARRALLARVGHDVDAAGLAGGPAIEVVVGEQAHATVLQALRLLGLGADRAVRVDADADGRMRPEALRERLAGLAGPVLVCAQAGQVDTGACDPLDAVAAVVAERDDAWLHVDGAFGLWAAAAPGRRHLVAGAARADSWAVDAHKWLNVPYDCAMAIVRDRGALTGAMTTSAAYLPLGDLDPSSRTPESSRRARAVPVHAALRALGRDGVADLVERCCVLARRAGDALARHPRLEVLHAVELNQVAFRPLDVDAGELAAAVQRDGTCWVGTTVRDGRPALRFSVSNWSTTPADVDRSVDRITALLDRGLEPPGCDRARPDPGGLP